MGEPDNNGQQGSRPPLLLHLPCPSITNRFRARSIRSRKSNTTRSKRQGKSPSSGVTKVLLPCCNKYRSVSRSTGNDVIGCRTARPQPATELFRRPTARAEGHEEPEACMRNRTYSGQSLRGRSTRLGSNDTFWKINIHVLCMLLAVVILITEAPVQRPPDRLASSEVGHHPDAANMGATEGPRLDLKLIVVFPYSVLRTRFS